MDPVTHVVTADELEKMTLGQQLRYLGQTLQALGQQFAAEYHRHPREVSYLLATYGLFIVAIIGVPIGFTKLKSWTAARLVGYIKERFPDDWHLPVHLRTLGWIVVLLLIIIMVLAFEMMKAEFTMFAWPLIAVTVMTFFTAMVASDVETRLLAGAQHRFIPRRNSLHLLFSVLSHPGQERLFRLFCMCARLRIIPSADVEAWPCRICGQPRFFAKHGFLEPSMP